MWVSIFKTEGTTIISIYSSNNEIFCSCANGIQCIKRIMNMVCTWCALLGLTHWGRVTHICISKQTSIGSDNGFSPGRHQAIIRTDAGILLIGPLGTNFSEISIEIHILSFKKMHLKMSSGKWWPFCLGLNVFSTGRFYLYPPSLPHWHWRRHVIAQVPVN